MVAVLDFVDDKMCSFILRSPSNMPQRPGFLLFAVPPLSLHSKSLAAVWVGLTTAPHGIGIGLMNPIDAGSDGCEDRLLLGRKHHGTGADGKEKKEKQESVRLGSHGLPPSYVSTIT